MFSATIEKLKYWLKFPGVVPPPETVASKASVYSIQLNIAIIIAIYGYFGDIVIALCSGLLLLFNCKRTHNNAAPLKKIVLLGLQAICILLFLWRFNGSTGGQSWMGLLALLVNLKALESSNTRDHYVTTLMLFFLAAIIFAYNNSAIAPVVLAAFSISILSTLMLLSDSSKSVSTAADRKPYQSTLNAKPITSAFRELKSRWKPAGKLLLQALPITIILFFLFPRIQGSFGFLPDDSNNLKPSLPSSMSTGSYSNRATSNALAFRVEFLADNSGKIPAVNINDLYWRVKTFSTQRHFNWALNGNFDVRPQNQKLLPHENDVPIRYVITHQPTADNHLPSLDSLLATEHGIVLNNQTIKAKSQPSTFQYEVSSTLNSRNLLSPSRKLNAELSSDHFQQFTQTTIAPTEKTQQLLNQWLNAVSLPNYGPQQVIPNADQAKQLALLALRHFREQPFSYHLIPPKLDSSKPIEDFLFRTQSGYCEHYSSTFSTLMRWLKVPSRIVAGFQGADYNEQGGFYEVRYSSAHAWSEIWTPDDGWIKTDPTAAVAPERIEFGMDALLALMRQNDQDSFSSGDFQMNKLRDALSPTGSLSFLYQTKKWFDAANHSWDKWIVNYSFEQQQKLLKKLGLSSHNHYLNLVLILGVLLSIIAAVILWIIWPKQAKRTPLDASYALFKQKIEKLGITIESHEGPATLRQKLIQALPHHTADIERIYQYYVENKYKDNSENLQRFILAVKRFQAKQA